MKKRRILQVLLICFLMLGICMVPAKKVQAAGPTAATLRANKTYKTYDITGDGNKDRFRVGTVYDSQHEACTGLSVRINNKVVYTLSDSHFYNVTIERYTLKNGKPFIYICTKGDNDYADLCALFQYRSGKFRKVIDFRTLFGNHGSNKSGRIVKISGDTVTARFYLMSYTVGPCNIEYTYKYSGGTLKRSSKYGTFDSIYTNGRDNRTFVANRNFAVFKSPGSTAKAFTLKKGKKVTATGKCWLYNGKMYIQIKYKKNYAWVKAASVLPSSPSLQLFSNVTYVG
ncbi:hypothetical protein [Ruminococcus sp. 5_1_39BFAA]|uniref:hypothetical protein n=1 Tax=Ruminococcus sp. 5_1_39BFAA TaxID=457412 RepID=UPI00356989EB